MIDETRTAQAATPQAVIEAPKLYPFIHPNEMECQACGFDTNRMLRFVHWLTGRMIPSSHSVKFCGGGKPLAEQAPGIEGAVFGGQREYSCAGIFVAHLHMRCGRCGVETLHEPRPRE